MTEPNLHIKSEPSSLQVEVLENFEFLQSNYTDLAVEDPLDRVLNYLGSLENKKINILFRYTKAHQRLSIEACKPTNVSANYIKAYIEWRNLAFQLIDTVEILDAAIYFRGEAPFKLSELAEYTTGKELKALLSDCRNELGALDVFTRIELFIHSRRPIARVNADIGMLRNLEAQATREISEKTITYFDSGGDPNNPFFQRSIAKALSMQELTTKTIPLLEQLKKTLVRKPSIFSQAGFIDFAKLLWREL